MNKLTKTIIIKTILQKSFFLVIILLLTTQVYQLSTAKSIAYLPTKQHTIHQNDKRQKLIQAFDYINSNKKITQQEKDKIIDALMLAEQHTQIDALLLLALAKRESNFSLTAKSHKGYKSIMQTKVASQRYYSVDILMGAEVLKEKLQQSNGNITIALSKYKGGANKPQAVYQAKLVLKEYKQLKSKFS